MYISSRFRRQLYSAIVKGIRRTGNRIFMKSQMYCPVKTGNLKHSGYIIDIPGGCRIGYNANYAKLVHDGIPFRELGGSKSELTIRGKRTGYTHTTGDIQVVHVRKHDVTGHERRHKSGKIYTVGLYTVRAHTRTYVGKRLVSMATKGEPGVFKVIYKVGKKPNPFLKRAIQEELKYLPEDIAFYMKQMGRVTYTKK